MTVRVLIVDDFELVRQGIRMGLEMEPAVEIVGEAGDGATAVAEAERLHPDAPASSRSRTATRWSTQRRPCG